MQSYDNMDVDYGYAMNRAERQGKSLTSLIRFDDEQAEDLKHSDVRRAYGCLPEQEAQKRVEQTGWFDIRSDFYHPKEA